MRAHRWKFLKSKILWEDAWMENGETVTWKCEDCGATCPTTRMDEQRGVRCPTPDPPEEADLKEHGVPQCCTESTVVEIHRL